ncbi:MAG: hypothetical protein IPJ20_10510 [Flammeovirgaceae bacterium]|nr:hypothetical protein [Flammeovirgaceae bacterium]
MYLKPQPWGDLGIDICLGLPMDKKASPYEYMFLPDYIESSFDHATINNQPIVKKKNIVFTPHPEEDSSELFHPWIVFGCFLTLTLVLSFYDWKRKKLTKWFDVLLFSMVGWVGILLLILWVATDHQAAARNLNLLWAFPLHAIAAVLLIRKKSYESLIKYFQMTATLLGSTLLFWWLLPQQLNVFLIPIIIALAIRSFLISKLVKVSSFKRVAHSLTN